MKGHTGRREQRKGKQPKPYWRWDEKRKWWEYPRYLSEKAVNGFGFVDKIKHWFDGVVARAIVDGLALHNYKPQPYKPRSQVKQPSRPELQASKPITKKIPWENQRELYEAIKQENLKTTYGAMIQDLIDMGVPVPPRDWHKVSDFWKK